MLHQQGALQRQHHHLDDRTAAALEITAIADLGLQAIGKRIEGPDGVSSGRMYSLISLHGGGSPEAMRREIWRNYPVGDKAELVARLLERNVVAGPGRKIASERQPGKCCAMGCTPPGPTTMVALPATRKEKTT